MQFTASKKHLLRLLSDAQFHSGQELALTLGISRRAIGKQIQCLGQLGQDICAVPGKGYRLLSPVELLDNKRIVADLTPAARNLITRLELHDEIHSTNRYLLAEMRDQVPSGTVCLAEHQTAGKGRMGRQWISPVGRNIYLSVLWRFTEGPGVLSGLSLATGVAVIRALREAGINETGLKWPNDIVWNRRKAGGILVEVSGERSGPCTAVVGLGLNLYMPPQFGDAITQAWVDIDQMMIRNPPSRNRLVALVLNHLMPLMVNYEQTGLAPYLPEWRQWDCLSGEQVTLYCGTSPIFGAVRGITDDGMIVIETETEGVRPYASGEVSFRSGTD